MSAESVRHTVSMSNPDQLHVYAADFETQILAFIDQHRAMLLAVLEGLTEEEAQRRENRESCRSVIRKRYSFALFEG